VFKEASKSLLSNTSIVAISLPIRIFEPRSLLQRICDWYGFAPYFLKEAALFRDPLERFKNTIAFAMSSLYFTVK